MTNKRLTLKSHLHWDPCLQCGDFLHSCSWGSTTEFSGGYSEQTCSAICSGCSFSISVTVQPEKLKAGQTELIERHIQQCWNAMFKQFYAEELPAEVSVSGVPYKVPRESIK